MPKRWLGPEFILYTGKERPPSPPRDYFGRSTDQGRLHAGHSEHHRGQSHHHHRHKHGRDRHGNRHREHKKRQKHVTGFDRDLDTEHQSSTAKSMDELLKNRRDEYSGCHRFLRYATTLFTFIVFIAGAALLGLGIYILGSDYGARQMSLVLENDLYQVCAYVLIASGAVLVLISVCGCCGAMRESRIMLGVFIFAISTLVIALVAAAAMVFVFRQKMEGDIVHGMEDVLLDKYGVELADHSENRVVTDMWNWLQRELKCCGVTGGVNSTTSWAIYRRSSWYQGFITGRIYVPESCCKPDGDINVCTGLTPINGPPTVGPPVTGSMMENPYLYTEGCYDELVHYIQDHAVIIGVASIASVVIMLFGLFFAVYLCRRIAGAALLGLGIYILGSDYGARQMSLVLENDLYQVCAYVLIASGAVLVLISVCGCCGAMRESRIMLGVFIFAISTLVIALVAAAAMVFVFRQKMEGDIVHGMEDVLLDKYGVELADHSENRVVTDMWNWLQRELKCCGVTGGVNSTTSWAIYRRSSWYQGFITGRIYVPESCCKPDGDINMCTGLTPINGPPTVGPPVTGSMMENPYLYTEGCYDELVHYIQDHAVIIGVASIASVVIMLFGLFFAVYLCRRVSVMYY